MSEFGFEANRNGPVEERGTYQFQADAAEYHLGVFASKPYLAGAMWFALQTSPRGPGWTGGDPLGDPAVGAEGRDRPVRQPDAAVHRRSSRSIESTVQIAPLSAGAVEAPAPASSGDVASSDPQENRQRSSVAMTRNPSTAVSFLPSSVARAR